MKQEIKVMTYITLLYLVWAGLMVTLCLWLMPVHAKVSTRTQPPGDPIFKSSFVDVIGVKTNADGSSTVVIDACGTKVYVTADPEDIKLENPEIKNQAMAAVSKACKP